MDYQYQSNKKRVRDDSEIDSPEVKRLREDLVGFLDGSDLVADHRDLTTNDLAWVMKSFEEEISASPSPVPVVDLTSDSGESQPEFGYLLEASDDELGLPPSISSSAGRELKTGEAEFVRVSSVSSGFGELWGFDDGIPSYDSLEFGIGDCNSNNNGEYVALEGLFDYSDAVFGLSNFSDVSWRPGTMPAL